MNSLLDRFCRYVRVETTADEDSKSVPSTPSQLELGRMLLGELKELGLSDAAQDQHGIVTTTIPATRPGCPAIAWLAHVDTSPEFTAHNIRPIIHENYNGQDIALPAGGRVIKVSESPELAALKGKTIITTDGSTLLGADDKCGVAVIMEAAAHLLAHPQIEHGPIRVCFTCDEEIGRGVDHLDPKQLGAAVAYTLDGEGQGKIENETFSADAATVTIEGVNIHPGYAKGKLVNSLRIAAEFISRMPSDGASPETTSGREGYTHPYDIQGTVAETRIKLILRDFETAALESQRHALQQIADELQKKHPRAKIKIEFREQYRNMSEGLAKDPRAVELAVQAMKAAGLEPRMSSIRGGTDGARLTALGLPTPNLSTGMHNYHSPLEWACLEEMQMAVKVLIELAKLWARQPAKG